MYNNIIFLKSDGSKNGLLLVFRLKLIREYPCKSVVDFAFCLLPHVHLPPLGDIGGVTLPLQLPPSKWVKPVSSQRRLEFHSAQGRTCYSPSVPATCTSKTQATAPSHGLF